jgi:hypothetical protein
MKALEELMQSPFISKTELRIVCGREGKFQGKLWEDGWLSIKSGFYLTLQEVFNDMETEAQRRLE